MKTKKKSNVIKLPTITKEFKRRVCKAEKVLKRALDSNFNKVVVVGINGKGDCVTITNAGKPCQALAMLEAAKIGYWETYSTRQIIEGTILRD